MSTESKHTNRGQVVCIGDLLVDVWWNVDTAKKNAEHAAVALISAAHDRVIKPGGVGIVIEALAQAKFKVSAFSVVDFSQETQEMLRRLQARANVSCCGVITVFKDFCTPVKTRYVNANGHILARHDAETPNELNAALFYQQAFLIRAKESKCVVVSDYSKGCISEATRKMLVNAAHTAGAPIYVDAKPQHLLSYMGADVIKLNMAEFLLFADTIGPFKSLTEAIKIASVHLRTPLLIVTDGGSGVFYSLRHTETCFVPTPRRYSSGNCVGAGDTFLAGLVLGFSEIGKYRPKDLTENDMLKLMQFGIVAAGQRVRTNSTKPLNADKLIREVLRKNYPVRRIMAVADLAQFVARNKRVGRKIVFTNGCFDLLHAGHIELLTQAKQHGDTLIVAVDADHNVTRLKGPDRPVQDQTTRAGNIAALDVVDAVCVFDDTADNSVLQNLIETIKPDVLVKGADYVNKLVVGADAVSRQEPPGEVVFVALVPNSSTTVFVNKLKAKSHE
jgi:D-beta-D-heptose 7-phosphate kinase/D-beta-D-heptose 1-phosphate adenosyltransferase